LILEVNTDGKTSKVDFYKHVINETMCGFQISNSRLMFMAQI